jgi:hypothetical protein
MFTNQSNVFILLHPPEAQLPLLPHPDVEQPPEAQLEHPIYYLV